MICLKCGKTFFSRSLLLVHVCVNESTNNLIHHIEESERQSKPNLAELTTVNLPNTYAGLEESENDKPTLSEVTAIDIHVIVSIRSKF